MGTRLNITYHVSVDKFLTIELTAHAHGQIYTHPISCIPTCHNLVCMLEDPENIYFSFQCSPPFGEDVSLSVITEGRL